MSLSSPPSLPAAEPMGPLEPAAALLPPGLLEAEERFYGAYGWCLNPCLTVRAAVERLGNELTHLEVVLEGWQRAEVLDNVYLLASALLNSVDDYVRGPVYCLPRRAALVPFARLALEAGERALGGRRMPRVRHASAWRTRAAAGLNALLRHQLTGGAADPGHALAEVVQIPLPADLQDEYTHIPSAFRKQDLHPADVLTLGQRFIGHFSERDKPVLAVGLRTAGSYFAPLFRALLETEGYQRVEAMTIRPGEGLGAHERAMLHRCAGAHYRVALLDDPPFSGDTLAHAADLLRQCGFPNERLAILFPVHPQRRGWRAHSESASFAHLRVLALEPEEWHKRRLLEPAVVEDRLTEYFRQRGYARVRVVPSAFADQLNGELEAAAEEKRRNRLKRVYEVRLETAAGACDTRFILAKSVGCGYLAYHAFLAGSRLCGFVPPLLGLRDGLLYMEWVPQTAAHVSRDQWIDTSAAYTAARARELRLPEDPTPSLGLNKQHDGFELLAKMLSKAYGGAALAGLMRSRVRRRLAALPCPVPALIDAKMRPSEWRAQDGLLFKTDFEHHGLGKNELNVVDPAYDLAETILHLALSAAEETRLLERYRAASGDGTVEERLYLYKLLAGLWTMTSALRNLGQQSLAHRQEDFHREFVRAWDFLTVQTARHCGRRCGAPAAPRWGAPLVVLDIDGVLDRRLFGFPCTSAAGIEALALLHGHGFSIALDTARSAAEVKEYCAAYGCAGAVAEYGSYIWDAVGQRGRVLVSAEALRQLERTRQALRRLPGVFVNDGYEVSIRACTYEEGVPVPLPTPLIQRVLAAENLLALHQTTIDSTITACAVDKGTGLAALLSFVSLPDAETFVVGDSEQDLPMFRVASRGFAPANISCARLARYAGCAIAPHAFQRGLLHIARALVHPDGARCAKCAFRWQPGEDLVLDLLTAADEKRPRPLARVGCPPSDF
jgi:hydroxymethylpyrimidine pyrophosphatase-like HAD family hydrolase